MGSTISFSVNLIVEWGSVEGALVLNSPSTMGGSMHMVGVSMDTPIQK